MSVRPRLAELDFVRAIAAISVVVIHVTASPIAYGRRGSLSMLFYMGANQLARFSIAAFVFITGVVLFYNYPADKPLPYFQFIRKRLTYIFIPYLIWSIIYTTAKIIITRGSYRPTLAVFAKDLALGNTFYHLYFIILIFQAYLLFPLILKLVRACKGHELLLVAVTFLGYALLMQHSQSGYQPHSALMTFIWQYNDRNLFWWSFYLILGGVVGDHWQSVLAQLTRHPWLVTGCFLASFAWITWDAFSLYSFSNYGAAAAVTPLRPVALVYTVCTLALLLILPELLARADALVAATIKLGQLSFAIYLAHPFVLTVNDRLLRGLNLPQLPYVAINLLTGILIPYLGALVLKRLAPRLAPLVIGK